MLKARERFNPSPWKRFCSLFHLVGDDPDPARKCWLWSGFLYHGYGRFWLDGTKVAAHRWAYEYFLGPVPLGWDVHHKCLNSACVNPYHLEAMTKVEHKRWHDER